MINISEYKMLLEKIDGRRLNNKDMAIVSHGLLCILYEFCPNLYLWNADINYTVNRIKFNIETIWHEDGNIMLHSDNPLIEADVKFESLPNKTMYNIFRQMVKAIINGKAMPQTVS